MYRAGELRQKEVININNASRMGYVTDVEVSLDSGVIEAIIVPGKSKLFNLRGNDITISWDAVKVIGDDVILVDYPCGE